MTSPRIFLTGATGFVGTQILKELKRNGCFVRATSRQKQTRELADEYVLSNDIFLEPVSWWKQQITKIDIVIHAAWYVEPGKYLESPINAKCLNGSLRLLEAFIESNTQHFAGIGTCFEYDLSFGNLSIDTPLLPTSSYASAKVELFHALQNLCVANKKSWNWCRLFYLYGEGEHPNRLVPHLHKKLKDDNIVDLTSGRQIRDFLDVKEAGRIIAQAAINMQKGPINVCSGIPITVREFAEQIADQYGRRNLLNFGARQENLVDPPKVVGVI